MVYQNTLGGGGEVPSIPQQVGAVQILERVAFQVGV